MKSKKEGSDKISRSKLGSTLVHLDIIMSTGSAFTTTGPKTYIIYSEPVNKYALLRHASIGEGMADRRSSSDQTQRGDDDTQNGGDKNSEPEHMMDKDGADQEEKNQQGPPLPVGFWDPSLRKVRLGVVKGLGITVLILMTFILSVMSLYWAVLFRVEPNMASLTVAVVDFDGRVAPYTDVPPLFGPAVVQAAQMQRQSKYSLGYVIRDPAEYNYDPFEVRRSIYNEHDWAAIIINANATALLQQAVATGNQSYEPVGAAQMIYVQARDEMTYANYITPTLMQFATTVQAMFGSKWLQNVLSNTSLSEATYSQAPQALNPAIGFSVFNLRPFMPAVSTPAITIGLIYLIIISFFSFSFFLPHHMKFIKPQGHPPMHFWEMCLWRLSATLVAYFLLSLAYSLVSLAFQIPFSNTYPHDDVSVAVAPDAYGKASFVVYWMVNWLGMMALGLASENVTMVIGQPWTALWLIFWVITNVSTSFYSIQLAPSFFKWGYAWPLYHVVRASRTIIFDVKSQIGLNVGVLFAWATVNCILFFPCCLFMRWKSNKEEARQAPRPTIQYLVDG